ncbi:MAG: hypothetical protein ACXWKC_09795 [Xanthobacteraceae bacterium]
MSLSKRELLAAGLALGFSTVGLATYANAQGAQNTPANMMDELGEEDATYYKAETGRFTKAKVKISAAHHAKAMAAGAKEVPTGTKPTKSALIYKHGGKLYMLENKPGTAAGKTMIQENFQEIFDGSHQY